jgi:hypothetical protein
MSSDPGHLLYIWSPTGYRLEPKAGPPPARGTMVELPEGSYAVQKVGASPLPEDHRPCAFLTPEPGPA